MTGPMHQPEIDVLAEHRRLRAALDVLIGGREHARWHVVRVRAGASERCGECGMDWPCPVRQALDVLNTVPPR